MQMSAPSDCNAVRSAGHDRTAIRWVICGLLFFAATINYVDRQVIGILKPTLQQEFGWSEIDYADIVFAFQLAYAIGFSSPAGSSTGSAPSWASSSRWSSGASPPWRTPRRRCSAAAAAIAARRDRPDLLGLGGRLHRRAACARASARRATFPPRSRSSPSGSRRSERAFATGLFNSGTNIGALLTPLVVPWITLYWGWYWAFVTTGALGFLWLLFWMPLYDAPGEPPARRRGRARATSRAIRRIRPTHIPWLQLLRYRQTWAFALGKFLTDPVWWLYLFWIPDFLNRNHGIDLQHDRAAARRDLSDRRRRQHRRRLAVVGAASSAAGRVNAGRKTAMLVCALAVLPMAFAVEGDGPVGGRRARRPRGLRAPGLVGESLHADLGHVPAPGGRLGRRPRRVGRRGRRHADREDHRLHPADDRQLRADLPHGGVRLPDGARW